MGSSREPDVALLERIRAGDEDAFRALFERHLPELSARIDRWLPARVRRKVSVSDVLQEAQIVAFRRLPEFVDRGREDGVRRWLLRVARLKVRAAVQRYATTAKRAVGREVTRGDRAATAEFAGREPTPSQMAVASETEDMARRALAALPEDYRAVLHLTMEAQLPPREVAALMGRSPEAVRKLYGRAVTRFTAEFERRRGAGDA
jgi:RNA polymerase sigma-70 factor (ECF subfamily)